MLWVKIVVRKCGKAHHKGGTIPSDRRGIRFTVSLGSKSVDNSTGVRVCIHVYWCVSGFKIRLCALYRVCAPSKIRVRIVCTLQNALCTLRTDCTHPPEYSQPPKQKEIYKTLHCRRLCLFINDWTNHREIPRNVPEVFDTSVPQVWYHWYTSFSLTIVSWPNSQLFYKTLYLLDLLT